MPNHPNRKRRTAPEPVNPAANPEPAVIRATREQAGLTQTGAAELIFCTYRGWQEWEAGTRRMHPAFWQLFNLKLSALPRRVEAEA